MGGACKNKGLVSDWRFEDILPKSEKSTVVTRQWRIGTTSRQGIEVMGLWRALSLQSEVLHLASPFY